MTVWLFVLFDLPTETKKERKDAYLFRRDLERDGFRMFQYSVYIRHCPDWDRAQTHERRIRRSAPEGGRISVLHVTDHEFATMTNIWGTTEKRRRGEDRKEPSLFNPTND